MNKKIKDITIISIFIALALVLSYVDSLIVILPQIYGVKLGLANIAIIYILYYKGAKEAIIVSILRVILASILFGNLVSLAYSLAGAILSLTLMIILKNFTSLGRITISIVGAISHNAGQIIMAIILMGTIEIVYYLPILIMTGLISGIGIGCLSIMVLKYTKNIVTTK